MLLETSLYRREWLVHSLQHLVSKLCTATRAQKCLTGGVTGWRVPTDRTGVPYAPGSAHRRNTILLCKLETFFKQVSGRDLWPEVHVRGWRVGCVQGGVATLYLELMAHFEGQRICSKAYGNELDLRVPIASRTLLRKQCRWSRASQQPFQLK